MPSNAMPLPPQPEQSAVGRTTQAREAKRRKIKQLLAFQDVLSNDAHNMELKPAERAQAMRTWIECEEQIRILKGRLKPGQISQTIRADPKPRRVSQPKLLPMPEAASASS